jgi:hypothetical protein
VWGIVLPLFWQIGCINWVMIRITKQKSKSLDVLCSTVSFTIYVVAVNVAAKEIDAAATKKLYNLSNSI